ncbi:MAG: hypothetical protein ACRD03_14480 [Acidimicrobiales bacterium]
MQRRLIGAVVLSLVAAACSGGGSSDEAGGGADVPSPFTPAPPAGAEAIPVEPNSYNYSPAVMDEGGVIKAWWCSARPEAATDNIWYQEYDKATEQYSGRRSVLQTGRPGTSDWDSFGVCHPSVIKGQWPASGGRTYTYAMYYTSTNEATGGGSNNSTGVVFSTDGITWEGQHDRYNPMIRQKVRNVPGTYGAGLPAAWSRGGSAVTLFWIDTTWDRRDLPSDPYASRAVVADSADGIRFGPARTISQIGAAAYWKNDFAFDDSVQPAVVYSAQALSFRAGTGPDDKNETYDFGLYRMPMDELMAGGGTWEHLGSVDTNLTGLPLNFEPGLVRTPEGKVAGDVTGDGLEVWFGGGGQTPATWQLWALTLDLNARQMPLRQYRSGGSYWATTGFVPKSILDADDDPEVLGLLDVVARPGQVPLFGCQRGPLTVGPDGVLTGAGADRYLSLEKCEGANVLGVNGYLYPEPPADVETEPLFACRDGGAQFVSLDPECDGKAVEAPLGHVPSA